MSSLLMHGDCLEMLKDLPDDSIDAIVTDPPYGLSFMGKKWDYDVPSIEIWKECLRVLKPGGHVLSFGGTRTYHRMVVNIEDAGFEIRDQVMWIYGSGFPKSHDVSKGIDKAAGAEREVVREKPHSSQDTRGNPISKTGGRGTGLGQEKERLQLFETSPSTEAAKQWQGWGTALKPANEPICLARKPLVGTVAKNVQEFGTGAINIDASRIEGRERTEYGLKNSVRNNSNAYGSDGTSADFDSTQGRWPANVLFDEEAAAVLDEQSGFSSEKARLINRNGKRQAEGYGLKSESIGISRGDSGGASRFFYVAKASKRERNAGLEGMPVKSNDTHNNPSRMVGSSAQKAKSEMDTSGTSGNQNHHPTVKPIKLMEYLVRMITPPGGVVLDPFMGSGTTGIAAKKLGFDFIGIEREAEYIAIAEKRIG